MNIANTIYIFIYLEVCIKWVRHVFGNTYYRWNYILYLIVTNPLVTCKNFRTYVNRENERKHAAIVPLAEEISDFYFVSFFNLVQSFVFKVSCERKTNNFYVATVSYWKRHCQRHDIITIPEFTSRVDENPRKSMNALARELHIDDATILWEPSLNASRDEKRTVIVPENQT